MSPTYEQQLAERIRQIKQEMEFVKDAGLSANETTERVIKLESELEYFQNQYDEYEMGHRENMYDFKNEVSYAEQDMMQDDMYAYMNGELL